MAFRNLSGHSVDTLLQELDEKDKAIHVLETELGVARAINHRLQNQRNDPYKRPDHTDIDNAIKFIGVLLVLVIVFAGIIMGEMKLNAQKSEESRRADHSVAQD